MQEVSELSEEKQSAYTKLAEDLAGLLTMQDVEHLAREIPAGNEAVVVLLEHVWALGLAQAVQHAGGILFTGGMVGPDVLVQVRAELAVEEKEENHAWRRFWRQRLWSGLRDEKIVTKQLVICALKS